MKFLKAVRRVGGRDTDIEIPFSESEDGSSQPQILLSKTLLTAAQIKGSDPDAGLTLVAAPGSNKIIVPALFMGVFRAGAEEFDNTGAALFVGSGYNASVWYGSWTGTINGGADQISTYDFFSQRLDGDPRAIHGPRRRKAGDGVGYDTDSGRRQLDRLFLVFRAGHLLGPRIEMLVPNVIP